ncbi:S53 family peptidase [Thermosporothrix hazakensis]|uniref:S53 family peptidase n=1 Tax=Thermosporothrix hazakensis TaxID=644383 RepID=UPI001475765C|nr:S53 family peptidase [Thermosporothrix hazakensis]
MSLKELFLPVSILLTLIGTALLQCLYTPPLQALTPLTIPGSLSPLLPVSLLKGESQSTQPLTISLGFRPRNEDLFNAYIETLNAGGSPPMLTSQQFNALFAPNESAYQQVRAYLESAGFHVQNTYQHRLLLTATGTAEQAEQTFGVNIQNYAAPDGHQYYATNREPRLPARLASFISGITGLNNAIQWEHSTRITARPLEKSARGAELGCPGPGERYYLPEQIARAYGFDSLYERGLRGEGQTIALFELDDYSTTDLDTYSACYGDSQTSIEQVLVGNGPERSGPGLLEVELDAEQVLSMAPGLRTLKIYEASNTPAGVLDAWSRIVEDRVPVVSNSWGVCEDLADPAMLKQENTLLKAAALQGQSIFVASGDSGSSACAHANPALKQLNVSDPASQPFVTAVGGTSLELNSDSTYKSESVWNHPTENTPSPRIGASGGGISHYWAAPSWQQAPGVINPHTSAAPCQAGNGRICRQIPDIALHADASKGYLIYCSVPSAGCNKMKPWLAVGGTSAGAPIWAAFTAITNQQLQKHGGGRVGFLNPLLYRLASNPASYQAAFHDITTGNNDFNGWHQGTYPATRNYDLATGLGSLKADQLLSYLVQLRQTRR